MVLGFLCGVFCCATDAMADFENPLLTFYEDGVHAPPPKPKNATPTFESADGHDFMTLYGRTYMIVELTPENFKQPISVFDNAAASYHYDDKISQCAAMTMVVTQMNEQLYGGRCTTLSGKTVMICTEAKADRLSLADADKFVFKNAPDRKDHAPAIYAVDKCDPGLFTLPAPQ